MEMLRRSLRISRWIALVLMVALIGGCGDDDNLTGSYQATVFTTQPTGGAVTNVLAAGGSISLVIGSDLSTSGTLSIPAGVQGGPVSVSLLGQAVELEGAVTLSLVSDTFLRDMDFTFDGKTLSGAETFSGVSIVVVLSK
jgi:hypothetical protein